MFGCRGPYQAGNGRRPAYDNHGCRGPAYFGTSRQEPFKRAEYQARMNPYGHNLFHNDYAQPRLYGRGLGFNVNGIHPYSRTYGESYSSSSSAWPGQARRSLEHDLFRRDYADRPRAGELRDRYGPASRLVAC
ncbi:hypothetical protein LTR78_001067 [Recurvomyces mirabilis]|uniref:Uncharacterized protein n=1 Tax=Recurvomyces mirabilis TaxID=574656 RepID=A0AAE0WX90_9PEZI|nr:hypothetical protein LTR78_001067 [Recurvomyces mirabilis]KAK5159039.1 hypothetical protein LTS14_003147 [Recurvomyces mirabilis]